MDKVVKAIQSGLPPISVVMSCYNAQRWLAESIESVLNQTWRDFEFIIVDDGSIDETSRIIRRYAAQDPRIVQLSKPNTGLADSLNTGIARARGVWIARLDADDLCLPERLALQWRAASANPKLVFVGSGLVLIDEYGRRFAVHRYPTSHQKSVAHLSTARKFPAHSSAFYRADAFWAVGGYRTRIKRSEDRDLWLRLSQIGQFKSLRQPLVAIRKHAGQISHEEGGMRQLYDAHVAMVGYWLRQAGHSDPVAGCEADYDAFGSWIKDRLAKENLLARGAFRQAIKQAASGRIDLSAIQIARNVLTHPALIWQLILEHFRGSLLPRRLASEWVATRRTLS